MRYTHPPLLNSVFYEDPPFTIHSWGIKKFIIFSGTLAMLIVLTIASIFIYKITTHYLNQAYSRNAMMRAMAQAHDIGKLLQDAQYELEYLSRLPLTPKIISDYLADKPIEERNRYREVAFEGKTPTECFVLVNNAKQIIQVPFEQAVNAKSGALTQHEQADSKAAGYIYIGDPTEVVYPALSGGESRGALSLHVIRLSRSIYGPGNEYQGRLILSLDLSCIRNILSLHNSKQSPLYLFPQDSDQKKSFFFDVSGWLLFQSEPPESQEKELSVDLLRIGMNGDVGRPGFPSAFRPNFENDFYWAMVSNVQAGKPGQAMIGRLFSPPSSLERTRYLSYIPIVFRNSPDEQRILGGIGCMDTSFIYMVFTYQLAGTLSICCGFGILIVLCSMYLPGRRISKQLALLSEAVDTRTAGDDHSPLALSPLFREINQFQRSVNILLLQLQIARSDTMMRESLYEDDRMRQEIDLEREIQQMPGLDPQLLKQPFYGIVGAGEAISLLRRQILKAAGVLADVLIVGETGTGKELTAEAIHRAGYRPRGPFLSINCGALDENLLLDALFGHVKGAFSDARDERQGAFLAASGGTLHLDEIGNASPKVQQALLRALSVRRIRPLGSDRDVPFDARIIAATNVDLLQLSLIGGFREDLYYRLAVITVHTPPLRRRKEDIPLLVNYFLRKHTDPSGVGHKEISRGALEKLMHHDWPGNIRELENCLTRSLAFAEGNLLLADHILFSAPQSEHLLEDTPNALRPDFPSSAKESHEAAIQEKRRHNVMDEKNISVLNLRQRKAWPFIVQKRVISRSEYQAAVGESIAVRTAQYDLYDMVNKGLLKKTGKGPTSRYTLIQDIEKK